MHGEVRVTVIATGFDRAVTGDQPFARTSGGVGVLPFPAQRPSRPSMPGMPAPQPTLLQAPRAVLRTTHTPTPGATDVPEMEIPTFIRRQMD